jgi:hypothetical protein
MYKDSIISFLPGYFQGLSKVFTTYPFDVMKIQMQSNKYNTFLECSRDLLKNNKKLFFRGISIPLVTFPIERAISYKLYEDMNKKKYNPYISALYGGVAASILGVPMQFLTTNAIVSDNYKGVMSFLKEQISKKNNIFKGYYLDTGRALLGSTLFLGTYGNIKKILPENEKSTILASLGSISFTWILTFPIDLVRVNFQISKNESVISIINKQYNNYGLKSFYRGLTPVLIRSVPSTIIGMLVYEEVKNMIKEIK